MCRLRQSCYHSDGIKHANVTFSVVAWSQARPDSLQTKHAGLNCLLLLKSELQVQVQYSGNKTAQTEVLDESHFNSSLALRTRAQHHALREVPQAAHAAAMLAQSSGTVPSVGLSKRLHTETLQSCTACSMVCRAAQILVQESPRKPHRFCGNRQGRAEALARPHSTSC